MDRKDIMSCETQYDFLATLKEHDLELPPVLVDTLWVNITTLCNQACTHCHIGASPNQTGIMSRQTIDTCLQILADNPTCQTLDITGGEPELHPDFRYFVSEARKLDKYVTVRHNLTVTIDGNPKTGENLSYLPEFFVDNQVTVLASLPFYEEKTTDRIRGKKVFEKSIECIQRLNKLGYGDEKNGLILNLVYNHSGPLSPDDRFNIESEFKRELKSRYGLVFNKLFAVTNMPINRYRKQLLEFGDYNTYMDKLKENFNALATPSLACRSLISVDHLGRIYDCDFNLALNLQAGELVPLTVYNFDLVSILNRKIQFGSHCFGCTAGGGSS